MGDLNSLGGRNHERRRAGAIATPTSLDRGIVKKRRRVRIIIMRMGNVRSGSSDNNDRVVQDRKMRGISVQDLRQWNGYV